MHGFFVYLSDPIILIVSRLPPPCSLSLLHRPTLQQSVVDHHRKPGQIPTSTRTATEIQTSSRISSWIRSSMRSRTFKSTAGKNSAISRHQPMPEVVPSSRGAPTPTSTRTATATPTSILSSSSTWSLTHYSTSTFNSLKNVNWDKRKVLASRAWISLNQTQLNLFRHQAHHLQ